MCRVYLLNSTNSPLRQKQFVPVTKKLDPMNNCAIKIRNASGNLIQPLFLFLIFWKHVFCGSPPPETPNSPLLILMQFDVQSPESPFTRFTALPLCPRPVAGQFGNTRPTCEAHVHYMNYWWATVIKDRRHLHWTLQGGLANIFKQFLTLPFYLFTFYTWQDKMGEKTVTLSTHNVATCQTQSIHIQIHTSIYCLF